MYSNAHLWCDMVVVVRMVEKRMGICTKYTLEWATDENDLKKFQEFSDDGVRWATSEAEVEADGVYWIRS